MSGLQVSIFQAGYCTCPEHIAIRGGRWHGIRFPAMFALFEHPRFGPLLFDTGYSFRFFEETRSFPNRLYRWLTPVTLKEDQLAVTQLGSRGIRPADVERVLISHFHADHIAALGDFPKARYVAFPQAYDSVRFLRGARAVSHAWLPGLLPVDFNERAALLDLAAARPLPPEFWPFSVGIDLLGDESLWLVELPGHAAGQMGVIARDETDILYFFVSDAAWLGRSIRENRPPHALANLLFPDPEQYRATLSDLNRFYHNRPEARVIPSHCAETLAKYAK